MTSTPSAATVSLAGLRLVVFAMIGGLVLFSAVAWVLVSTGFETDSERAGVVYPVLGGVLLISLVGGLVVRRMMIGKLLGEARGASKEERLRAALPVYRTWTLVGSGLAEAPGLVGVVAFLLSGSPIGLLVTALSVLRLVLLLPSEAALDGLADALGE